MTLRGLLGPVLLILAAPAWTLEPVTLQLKRTPAAMSSRQGATERPAGALPGRLP